MKSYKIVASFGDGLPKETTVVARTGTEAQDKGFKQFPGARMIRVVSGTYIEPPPCSAPVKQKEHPLFTDWPPRQTTYVPKANWTERRTPERTAEKAEEAIKLRRKGLSYSKIAAELDVAPTSVRRWVANSNLNEFL